MLCGTLELRWTPDEEYWARLYFSTHTEIHFDEHKSNYSFIRFKQKWFCTQQKLLPVGKKLRALTKADSSPQPHVCPQSSTILLPSFMTLYKDYDQTRTSTQHSINQPCSAGVGNQQPAWSFYITRNIIFVTQIRVQQCVKTKIHVEQVLRQ